MKDLFSLQRTRRHVAACASLLLLLSFLPTWVAPAHAALSSSVDFDNATTNVADGSSKSVLPAATIDANNYAHAVYLQESGQQLMYTTNLSSSSPGSKFSKPVSIEGGAGLYKDSFMQLLTGPGNVLYLLYARNAGSLVMKAATISGTTVSWQKGATLIGGVGKIQDARGAFDASGNLHLTWIDKRCGEYKVHYRIRYTNGSLSGDEAPGGDDCTFEVTPRIAVTSDGKAHIVYTRSKDIYYARREKSGWVRQKLAGTNLNEGNGDIATNGTNLMMVWGVGLSSTDHNTLARFSKDGGQSWSNSVGISTSSSYAEFPSVAYAAQPNRYYVAWSDNNGSLDGAGDIWFREFSAASDTLGEGGSADRVFRKSGASDRPVIVAGASRFDIFWQDRALNSLLQIFHDGGKIAGGTCNATVSLGSGADTIKTASTTLSITPESGCSPSKMQVSIDTPITSSTPEETYAQSKTVTFSDLSLCTHTVYVRLIASGRTSNVAQDSIVVDGEVTANVGVTNPYLVSSGVSYTSPDGKSIDGDRNYTRNGAVLVSVVDRGDCKGLKNADVPILGTQPINNGALRVFTNLTDTSTTGAKNVNITVRDNVDNTAIFPGVGQYFTITYDNTPPTFDKSKARFTGPITTTDAVVTLTMAGASVTDDLYGQREGIGAGGQYWGVWVAVSTNATPPTDTSAWVPAEIPDRDGTFTLDWSLVTGKGGAYASSPGTYYVHVRFLDGAGNPSDTSITSNAIVLQQGYSTRRAIMPLTVR